MMRCQVKTEDGDECYNEATYRLGSNATLTCEECMAALIDEGKFGHDSFEELEES